MSDFPYTTVPGKLKQLMKKIREVGVPSKANTKWLNSIGFKSSNDRTLLKVLTFIGLIDSASSPSEIWKNYRGANFKAVLAKAIMSGYSELFDTYPDAHQRSFSDLQSFFSTRSSAGKQAVAKTITTFQNLCALADFSEEDVIEGEPFGKKEEVEQPTAGFKPSDYGSIEPSVHIDIQIHISPDASTDQIDQIFSSMAKHLYKKK